MADELRLQEELKGFIIETLALEDISPSDITNDMALFGDGLGLDSVDALELGVALQKKYGVTVDADSEKTREYFANIQSLATLVASHSSDQPSTS